MSAAVVSCSPAEISSTDKTHEEVQLSRFVGASPEPPYLEYENSKVDPYVVDWKSPEGSYSQDKTGQPLALIQAEAGIGESTFYIRESMPPASLSVSIFTGESCSLDPHAPPDKTVDCLETTQDFCTIGQENDFVAVTFSGQLIFPGGKYVIALNSEYFAHGDLSSERSANYVSWVFDISLEDKL